MTQLQQDFIDDGDAENDKARRGGQAESVLQAELSTQVITGKRRATRRLERALAACVASGAMSMAQAVSVLSGGENA